MAGPDGLRRVLQLHDLSMELGTDCDWCGRIGRKREYEFWEEGRLVGRDPVLCDVCNLLLFAPGDIEDLWRERVPGAEHALDEFERTLEEIIRTRQPS